MSELKVIEWIRYVRDKNYKETKDMSKKEILEFYRKKAKTIHKKSKSFEAIQK